MGSNFPHFTLRILRIIGANPRGNKPSVREYAVALGIVGLRSVQEIYYPS